MPIIALRETTELLPPPVRQEWLESVSDRIHQCGSASPAWARQMHSPLTAIDPGRYHSALRGQGQ